MYCHGPDDQESGLRLDLRSGMLKGGDSGLPAVVPENAQASYLIEVVKHLDPDVKMPPDEDQIPPEEIALLEQWIAQGAVVPGQMDVNEEKLVSDHWAFQPVLRPELPPSEYSNPVDRFLAAKLEDRGLEFSPLAGPRSLLRRVSIVLTGLPPTSGETDSFISAWNDDQDAAYSQLVERLLASEHFGERWAQHWLDVIRWAETNGSEANLYRKNAWVYRDYVVRSFNEDKPYSRFVKEQIAGDSMGMGEATGFLVAGPHVPAATVGREPTAIRQARADRMDEVMQTVGASMMGITVGCARCHNHKFDPISIQDYYAMTAVFQDVEFGSRRPEYSSTHPLRQRAKVMWKNIAAQRKQLRDLGGWEENWGAYRELHFKPATTQAIRVRFKMKNVGLDEMEVLGPDGVNVNFALASRGTKVSGFPAKGVDNRNPIDRVNDGEYGTMAWRAKPVKDEDTGEVRQPWVRLDFDAPVEVNRLRLSSNREYYYDTDYLDKKPFLPRYEYDVDILTADGEWQPWTGTWAVNKKLNQENQGRKKLNAELDEQIRLLGEEGPRPSFVGRFVPPKQTYVLLRGSPESPRGEVAPAAPEIFNGNLGLPADSQGAVRRAKFADWVASESNPLTARVMVNRLWHHVFGTGIVPTTSDFGTAGALPTHPLLLDWLAAEFANPSVNDRQARPWSVKRMLRLLVHSHAFHQSSEPDEAGERIDAGGQLLWRFPPKRVEAEVIRDSILLASGNLDRRVGGKSYRIHNEKKTYAQWQVVNNHGPETWRRMLYQERMRRVDDQMFTAFDFPDCGQVRAKRPVSTTPLQALNLLNSEFVLDQAERIADRATRDSGGDEAAAVNRCFHLLLGRDATDAELDACLATAQRQSLANVCRALINSNEFAFLP
ncbi:MAG: PSD1 and planctomycete cytochrome C domain-containing protein [Aureliella sp.]